MNRMLVVALLVVNLIVLGTAVRVIGAYRSVAPHQTAPLTVTASAFTYQGRLQHNGQLVTGPCDFSFDLFDASNAGNLIGGQELKAMPVTAGLFTVVLDFGADAFNGGPRWLETTVQCDEAEGTWTLAPRQPITVAPIALSARSLTTDAAPQLEGNADDALLSVINHGDGPGLRARSDNGHGVIASSPTGAGVIGTSGTGPGLSGNTTHGTGVYGYGYASDAVGVTGEGNNGAPAMKAKGNAVQDSDFGGWAKAMLNVNQYGSISECYNGVTGVAYRGLGDPNNTSLDCGFTISKDSLPGYYRIRFDFPIGNRFFAVTPQYAGFDNFYVSATPTSGNDTEQDLAVFVWALDHAEPADNGFSIVVY